MAALTNAAVAARCSTRSRDVLEITGELAFKVGAYRRAADSIAHSPIDVLAAYRAGTPPRLEGVGKAIDEKLAELARHGPDAPTTSGSWRTVPPSLVTLLARARHRTADRRRPVASPGHREPRRPRARRPARAGCGRSRASPRRPRSASSRARRARDPAAAYACTWPRRVRSPTGSGRWSRRFPGVASVTACGSVRRGRETVGDLDLLVACEDPAAVLAEVHAATGVERVVAGVRGGGYRTSVQLLRGPQVDVMTMAPDRAGTYLVHFTGSAAHNVRLRERARDLGWSLSEHGFARLAPDGQVLEGPDAELRTFASEEEVYALPRPAVHRARRCARTVARSRPRSTGRLPDAGPRGGPPGRLPHATPSGRTARSRSRRWRRPHVAEAMPTRCSPTTPGA